VPTEAIGVLDVATAVTGSGEVVVFEQPVLDVRLPTGSKLRRTTTALRFREPARIPPVRRLAGDDVGIDRRASRSAAGVRLDGVHLAFRDPAAARRALLAAGAEPIVHDLDWWRRWRSSRTDPVEARAVVAAARRVERSTGVVYAFLALCGALGVAAGFVEGRLVLVAFAASCVALLAHLSWVRARVHREVRAAREAADLRGGFRSGP
jgi:hypothetical protein